MSSTPAPIISGRPYRVLDVAGKPVQDLSDLVGNLAEFTIDHSGDYVVRGSSRWDQATVKFYEKDCEGTGKDMRVWRVVQTGPEDFTAEHIIG